MQVFSFKPNKKRSNCDEADVIPRSSFVPDVDSDDGYSCFQPQALCPTLLGIPSRRKRKYTMWLRRATSRLDLRGAMHFQEIFEEMFFKDLVASASIYLAAPRSVHEQETREELVRQGFDFDGEEVSGDMALRDGDFRRMQGYMRVAEARGLVIDGVWQTPVAIANLAQTTEFSP
jgi:hypothetical protein